MNNPFRGLRYRFARYRRRPPTPEPSLPPAAPPAGSEPAGPSTGAAPGEVPLGEADTAVLPPVSAQVRTAVLRRRRRKRRLVRALLALVAIVALGFGILFVAYARTTIPDPNAAALRQTSQVYYSDGKVEIGRFGDTNRVVVPLSQMPEQLRNAVLAAENRSFYTDSGVSPRGILRALWVNLRGGSVQGGSTITQQYVKNYYLNSQRTLSRKITEALLAIKIDKKLSKDQILENYLNTIYLGRGAYGVEAAAAAYFHTDVRQLTPAQDAVLAAVIRSPAHYDPSTAAGRAALEKRWAYVLDGMVSMGKLSPAERAAAVFPTIPPRGKDTQRFGGQRGYILTAVEDELVARGLTKDQVENGGLHIVTTLDSQAQAAAEKAVPEEFPKTKNEGVRVGLAAIQPQTGRILAMYGGKDFLGTDRYAQVNSATYPIEPGSGMKPFALAAALENGYGLNSVFDGNSPLALPGNQSIRNEFNTSYGPAVPLLKGLEQSINTVFVDLAVHLGPPKIRNAMVRAGVPNNAPGLANVYDIPLGTFSIPPTVVAAAYATLCGNGVHANPHIVEQVLGPSGAQQTITNNTVSVAPVFSAPVRSDVLRAMEDVVANGTGKAAQALGRPVAGKTGTHQSLTAWFNGCTPQIAASVDYFKGDGTESLDGVGGLSTFFGAVYPAQTWTTFMTAALKGKPVENFTIGKGVNGTLNLAPTATPTSTVGPTGSPAPLPSGLPSTSPPETKPPVSPPPSKEPSPKPTKEPPTPTGAAKQ